MRGFLGFLTITFFMLLAFIITFIPIMLVDSGILFLMGEYTPGIAVLFQFLLIFYIVDIIVSFFAELLFGFIEVSQGKMWPRYVHIALETIVTFFVITVVDEMMASVDLSSWTHLFIALSHALLGELVHSKKIIVLPNQNKKD